MVQQVLLHQQPSHHHQFHQANFVQKERFPSLYGNIFPSQKRHIVTFNPKIIIINDEPSESTTTTPTSTRRRYSMPSENSLIDYKNRTVMKDYKKFFDVHFSEANMKNKENEKVEDVNFKRPGMSEKRSPTFFNLRRNSQPPHHLKFDSIQKR